MKYTTLLLFLLTLIPPPMDPDEINMEYSIEWLAVDSDYIIKGKLKEYSIEKNKGGENMYSCIFEISQSIKGNQNQGNIYFSLLKMKENKLKSYIGKEVMVFLYETEQGYIHGNGHNFDKWVKRLYYTEENLFIPVDNPNITLLSARDFSLVEDIAKIEYHIEEALCYHEEFLQKEGEGVSYDIGQVETPFESEAFRYLYQGSACFLYVPDYMVE